MVILWELIIILVTIIFIAYIVNKIEATKKEINSRMSFKEALDLTSLPIVTFENNGRKINFLLDTGASKSIINVSELSTCKYENAEGTSILTGIDGIPRETENVKLILSYNNKEYVDVFQKTDMSSSFDVIKRSTGVNIHGILGTAFFNKYKYILDFDKLIAYSKK